MNGCSQKKTKTDVIFFNAKVYTVDSNFSIAEGFAIDKGKFIAIGSTEDINSKYEADTSIDLHGNFVYPGFIDAHCHFVGYARTLNFADLNGTKSFEEVLMKMKEYNDSHSPEWIIGRGWDQNDWEDKTFPNNTLLNEYFPDKPVVLTRIDGHAALVNSTVLKLAGINSTTKIDGGEIILQEGKPTGMLIDNAMNLYINLIPETSDQNLSTLISEAQNNCFRVGLTSVTDAGLDMKTINLINSLHKSNDLKMRINAMLNPDEINLDFIKQGEKMKTDYLNVNSLKLYADGALGSRGACLIEPYSDQPEHYGLTTITFDSMMTLCNIAFNNNYQVCVHAIGDSANRTVLKAFSSILKEKNDRRWRIEHCQVIHENDFSMFGKYNIVPSIQPTHATSDMYWAEERLGTERIKNSYAYKKLLDQNEWLPCGSDFPIEDINPLFGYYAAVSRKDQNNLPESGFQFENALSRVEALKGMTIWAAKAAFEENEKGSIEIGKFADFVVLEKDILEINIEEIPKTKILKTISSGKVVYSL